LIRSAVRFCHIAPIGALSLFATCGEPASQETTTAAVAAKLERAYDLFSTPALEQRVARVQSVVEECVGRSLSLHPIRVRPISIREYVHLGSQGGTPESADLREFMRSARANGRIAEYHPSTIEIIVFPETILSLPPSSRESILDVALAHELVHVYQDRILRLRFKLDSPNAEERAAWRATLEGHAEYLARKAAILLNAQSAFEQLASLRRLDPSGACKESEHQWALSVATGPMTEFYYESGAHFVASVARSLGDEAAASTIFANPPRTLVEVDRPSVYLGADKAKHPSTIGMFYGASVQSRAVPRTYLSLQLARADPDSTPGVMRDVLDATSMTLTLERGALRGRRGRALLVRTASPTSARAFAQKLRDSIEASRFWIGLGASTWSVDHLGNSRPTPSNASYIAMRLRSPEKREGDHVHCCVVRNNSLVLQLLVWAPPRDSPFVVSMARRFFCVDRPREDSEACIRDSDPNRRLLALFDPVFNSRLDKPLMSSLIDDIDGEVRAAAMEALKDAPEEVASAILESATLHRDPAVRARACGQIALLPRRKRLASLLHLLEDQVGDVRRAAVEASASYGASTIRMQVERLLGDPDPRVRAAASRAIAQQSDVDVGHRLRLLLPLVDDDSLHVRQIVWSALGELSVYVGVPELVLYRALDDPNIGVRLSAVDCLKFVVTPRLGAIRRALADPSATVRAWASLLLVPHGERAKQLVPCLIKALDDPACRFGALDALRRIKAPEALPSYCRLLEDTAYRSFAAESLSSLGLAETTPVFVALLRDWDPMIRCLAVDQLRKWDCAPPDATAILGAVLTESSSWAARKRAVRVLGLSQVRSREAIPLLVRALEDASSEVRLQAAVSLGTIRPVSRDAVLALASAREDPMRPVQLQALRSLRALGHSALPSLHRLLRSLERERDPELAQETCDVLVAMGAKLRDIEPTLDKLRGSEHPAISELGAETIRRIKATQ
jgi:HEAT repeat protein